MIQIVAECVGGVEIVFRKRERAGGGGGPGVHQGRLQHLIFFRTAPDKAAAVFDEQVHFGPEIEAVAQVRESAAA